MKTIVLIDYEKTGHHPNYVALFSTRIAKMGYKVIVVFPFDEYKFEDTKANDISFIKPIYRKVGGYRFNPFFTWLYNVLNVWKVIYKTGCKPNLVYFLWADNLRLPADDRPIITSIQIFIIKMLFRWKWAGLYFHPAHYRKTTMSVTKRKDKIFDLPQCVGVNILDEGILSLIKLNINNEITVLPDITDEPKEMVLDRAMSRMLQKLKNSDKIISCVGAIQKRKGIISLLKLSEYLKEYQILIAGKFEELTFTENELRDYEKLRTNTNVTVIDHYLTNDEINTIYTHSMFLWAVYLDFPHSSGVMTKSAFFKKPVIVNNEFLMKERVERYKIGFTIDTNNLAEAEKKIREHSHLKFSDTAFNIYFREHSNIKFEETLNRFLKKVIG